MRILELGHAHSEDVFKASCTNCGTSVEFMRSEARCIRAGRERYVVVVDCPVCLAEIWADALQKKARGTSRKRSDN